jgi:general secretion pathway protein A
MYLDHFGLATAPFSLSPRLEFLYTSTPFEETIAHLVFGLENQEAITLISGPIGSGKTMTIHSFISHLSPQYATALVNSTQVTPTELLKLILEDLGVTLSADTDKSDLLISFKDFLIRRQQEGGRVLVIIDEAQNLSTSCLEEIRLLTNLGQFESQPVQMVLVGQPELETTVNQPQLAQLRQRIRVRYRISPLSREEVAGYIRHRMSVAGCQHSVFAKDAVDTIFRRSEGIPRLVNTLAGDALLAAFVENSATVTAAHVAETP